MRPVIFQVHRLIDEHGSSYSTCKGCEICTQIENLRGELDPVPESKFRDILKKGQDMTKSDITYLISKGVAKNEIRKWLKMDSIAFTELLKKWGLLKKNLKELEVEEEGTELARKRLPITIEQYVQLKLQGFKEKEIAANLGVTEQQLWTWKSYRKHDIKEALINAQISKETTSETNTTQNKQKSENQAKNKTISSSEVNEVKTLIAEFKSKEEEKLKKEVIDAHKQITEWQEKYIKLNDRFSQLLIDRDKLIEENQNLENAISRNCKEISSLRDENNRLSLEKLSLQLELKPLKELLLLNLSKEVNSA